MKYLLLVLVLALVSTTVVLAVDSVDDRGNPNDPAVNERANACYAGASMAGQCGDNELMWIAGWYLIRFEHGLIGADQIPADLLWILPKPDVPPIKNAPSKPIIKK